MASPVEQPCRVGWDIGGAHVKACLHDGHGVVDVAQWACPLWQGLQHLDAAIEQAESRWPQAWADARTQHAATMTGEMVDLFADRQDGVARLATHLAERLGPPLRLYAGAAGWCAPQAAREHWPAIASANWRATADVLAPRVPGALLLDIGSTTTDIIALRDGRVAAQGSNDAQRLASGELFYQGVVRTPLCALAPQVEIGGARVNVMNEFFATTADVYRLTGELDAAHDQGATADGAAKSAAASRQRIARMVGRDAGDHDDAQWLALARFWRDAQLTALLAQVTRVAAASGLPPDAPVIGAGCGAFLAAEVARRVGRPFRRFAAVVEAVLPGDAASAAWLDVCAPAVAVALLMPVASAHRMDDSPMPARDPLAHARFLRES